MPELPEVETIVRQLRPLLTGQTIQRLVLRDAKLAMLPPRALVGCLITDVIRLGKQVVLALERPPAPSAWLAVHLRMTGRLVWAPPRTRIPRAHCRAVLHLTEGRLLFVDPRRFGTLTLHHARAALEPRGMDPTTHVFTTSRLAARLRNSRQAIKVWLLRQDGVVGIGNIYACEALFRAGISPWRPAGELTPRDIRTLSRALRTVLKEAIAHCGTTFSDFQDAHGVSGNYQRFLRVYGREHDPCPRCRALLQRAPQQGRSTFFCPTCQHWEPPTTPCTMALMFPRTKHRRL